VCLVIEVEAVSDEFIDFDFGGAVEAALTSMLASLARSASGASVTSAWTTIGPASTSAFSARRAIFSVLRGGCCCRLIGHGF
jgi:hypothetical protein